MLRIGLGTKLATRCGERLLLTGEFQLQLSLALLNDTVLLYHVSGLFNFFVSPWTGKQQIGCLELSPDFNAVNTIQEKDAQYHRHYRPY